MQRLQEAGFSKEYDYRIGSPHLRHWILYDQLVSQLRTTVQRLDQKGMPLTVLEIGAGHGGYTEVALALGCRVTATEMSRPSLERLQERFGTNQNLSARLDDDGTLDALGSERFALILAASVLHHIPDYRGFLSNALGKHLLPGGSFLSFQDPMWYPTLKPSTHYFERMAYVSWRMSRGSRLVGAANFIRRLRGIYDEGNPNDMVEYHTLRQGVDHDALVIDLTPWFEQCSLITYWSTQAPLWQAVGDRLGLANTFAIHAEQYRGPAANPEEGTSKPSGSGLQRAGPEEDAVRLEELA